jgi:hypothetical protein
LQCYTSLLLTLQGILCWCASWGFVRCSCQHPSLLGYQVLCLPRGKLQPCIQQDRSWLCQTWHLKGDYQVLAAFDACCFGIVDTGGEVCRQDLCVKECCPCTLSYQLREVHPGARGTLHAEFCSADRAEKLSLLSFGTLRRR